jgi:UDP-glucuronate 4-epimerase
LEQCLGKKAIKNMLPLQDGDVPDTYADVTDLVEDLGYAPATLLEEGIRNFVLWYKDYYRMEP